MNLYKFKNKIENLIQETNEIKKDERIDYLEDLLRNLRIVNSFLEDKETFKVLNKYNNNANVDLVDSPLASLCQKIITELNEIDENLNVTIVNMIKDYKQKGNTSPYYDGCEIEYINEKITSEAFQNKLSAFNSLKHLDGHNKTLVVLGPNGCGKTTYANYMKKLDQQICVISVPHIICDKNNESLINNLCAEYDEFARYTYETNDRLGETKFEKIKRIFEEYFNITLDTSGFSKKIIQAKDKTGKTFEFKSMSDGERAAFNSIATVITADNNSFIIVDEPESFLNPAIYNKLWDRLIEERNDCQFIFITHDVDFVNTRSNFEVVSINDFTYPNQFNFKFFDGLEGIDSELLIKILGSRKPILFCEGKSDGYDYKVYSILFGEKYTVIPVGNCDSVEKTVESCNKIYNQRLNIPSAVGIIDSDMKNEEGISELKNKNIYCLKCNEIEMLLIDEEVFKEVISKYEGNGSFDKFKNDLFEKLKNGSDIIIRRYVKTQIDEMLRKLNVDDKNNMTKEDFIENLQNNIDYVKNKVDEVFNDCQNIITKLIELKDYDSAIKYCCFEHGDIIVNLCNQYKHDYARIAIDALKNEELSNRIIEKYLNDFPRANK